MTDTRTGIGSIQILKHLIEPGSKKVFTHIYTHRDGNMSKEHMSKVQMSHLAVQPAHRIMRKNKSHCLKPLSFGGALCYSNR